MPLKNKLPLWSFFFFLQFKRTVSPLDHVHRFWFEKLTRTQNFICTFWPPVHPKVWFSLGNKPCSPKDIPRMFWNETLLWNLKLVNRNWLKLLKHRLVVNETSVPVRQGQGYLVLMAQEYYAKAITGLWLFTLLETEDSSSLSSDQIFFPPRGIGQILLVRIKTKSKRRGKHRKKKNGGES